MKALKLFLLVGILTTFVFTSCNKDDQTLETPQLSDVELLTAIYNSDAATDNGKVKDGDKFGLAVRLDELPADLRAQLEGKKNLNLDANISIDAETAKSIWGDKVSDESPILNGFSIDPQDVELKKVYMSEDGEDITAEIEQNPELLNDRRVTVIDYIYIELICVAVYVNGQLVAGGCLIYAESCTIVII